MPYTVTLATGTKDVLLPNGLRCQAGDVSFLTDKEYSLLSPTSGSLFSAVAMVGSTVPATSVTSQAPILGDDPYAEGSNEPSTENPDTSPSEG